jgi:hypothetical protein
MSIKRYHGRTAVAGDGSVGGTKGISDYEESPDLPGTIWIESRTKRMVLTGRLCHRNQRHVNVNECSNLGHLSNASERRVGTTTVSSLHQIQCYKLSSRCCTCVRLLESKQKP